MHRLGSVLSVALLLCLAIGSFAADVPQLLNYQGRLVTSSGTPVDDGEYRLIISLYDAATGGNRLWTETNTVRTTGGLFSVILGNGNPISLTSSGSNIFLEVQIEGNNPMFPRHQIVSVAFALKAEQAEKALSVVDQSVTEEKLAPGLFVPVGAVIAWWGSELAIPQGWKLCDGRAVDDPLSPLYNKPTPDLVGSFVRGAAGNVFPNPPTGGSDSLDLRHGHTVNTHRHVVDDHGHVIPWEDHHLHYMDHQHTGQTDPYQQGGVYSAETDTGYRAAFKDHIYTFTTDWTRDYTDPSGGHSHGGATRNANPGTSYETPGTTDGLVGSRTTIPRYVGLLYIIRIR